MRRAGTQAPGVLTVMFRAGTSDHDRAAAAKAVGGTLGFFVTRGSSIFNLKFMLSLLMVE